MKRLTSQPYFLALVLMLLGFVIIALFQPNFFQPRTFGNNLRSYLPLICLAVAQTIVVIGGGIDLSVGAMLTLSSVVMVQAFGPDINVPTERMLLGIGAGLLVATLAGAVNGWLVAYLRLQPIIATFATAFVWSGLALWVLPQPGGNVPQFLQDMVRLNVLLPFTLWVVLLFGLLWYGFLRTRPAKALYAVGGNAQATFASGVNVELTQLSSYAACGFMTGVAALVMTADVATADTAIGAPLTLASVVAVVIGGTRLSGGAGGIWGSMMGAAVYYLLTNVVALAVIRFGWSSQLQTLLNGIVIVLALAGPGLVYLSQQFRRKA